MEKFVYSVVICSYNKLESIKKVVEKIKKLRPESEIIISDDFSTDGTIEWARKSSFVSRFHVQKESGNYRLNSVRNCGINLASKKYVILLDADCLPEDSFFNGYDDAFNQNPSSPVIGITERYDSLGEKIVSFDPRWCLLKDNKVEETGWENFYGGNVAFPKSLWENNKFDESYNGYWGFEDLDFSIRLSLKNIKFYLSFYSSVRHLEHPTSQHAKDAYEKNFRNRDMFEEKYKIKFTRKNDEIDRKRMLEIKGGEEIKLEEVVFDEKKISKLSGKKIILCSNVRTMRNGKKNPKDYPYWKNLIHLLRGNNLFHIEGEVPLKELKDYIENCDFFISTDSFFQHYAWSLGKRGVVIFSVTDPLIFGHKLHINILKDRRYLKPNQFSFVEETEYNINAFEHPDKIVEIIERNYL